VADYYNTEADSIQAEQVEAVEMEDYIQMTETATESGNMLGSDTEFVIEFEWIFHNTRRHVLLVLLLDKLHRATVQELGEGLRECKQLR
jgi:hypothetical protein